MTDVRLVGLLILPSENEAAWQTAIGVAARERDWVFTKPSAQLDLSHKDKTILLVSDIRLVPYEAVDVWVVIGATPVQAVARSLIRKRGELSEARRFASNRFAAATTILEQGGLLLENGAEELVLPGLGAVRINPSVAPALLDEANPLAFYSTLPPLPGAGAHWPTSIFSYTMGQIPIGGGPEITLTGRGRILVHGPYLDLPPGWWRMTVRFEVTPEDRAYLRFDWGFGQNATQYHAELDRQGAYELVLDHLWSEAGPAELRIWAERGHFLGQMTLRDCSVERLTSTGEAAVKVH